MREDEAALETAIRDAIGQIRDYAIIVLDPQGAVRTWNDGGERLTGWTGDEAIGMHFADFHIPEERRAGLPMRLLDEARTAGRVANAGWRLRKDGSRFWAEVVLTAIRDDDGALTGFVKVTRDVTDEHAARMELAASEQRFRLLVSQVVDYAIISLDQQGLVQSWNSGAERLKGYTADEAVGLHFGVFYTDEDRAAGTPLRLLDEARSAGHVEHSGWRVRKDGTRFWADVVLTAIHDDTGQLTGFAKVTRDRTEQHGLAQARDAFFASAAHDLKAPVATIRGFMSLWDQLPEADKDGIAERVARTADDLSRFIDDLLEHARLRSGIVELKRAPMSLRSVLEDVAANTLGAEVGRTITVEGPELTVLADETGLRRIVGNLLVNAIRYSPDDADVTIAISERGDLATVQVVDQGRGVAPEDLETIFEEFERGSLATNDGGNGLGLSIVRMLVEQHGGEVWLDSAVEQGTTATFTLPLATAREGEPTGGARR